jgi:hypothetical protein
MRRIKGQTEKKPMSNKTSAFSESYVEARQRFRVAAQAAGAACFAYDLNIGAPRTLTIDVALAGADDAPALVLSSGVHGIEGFFGSAVQLAMLERMARTARDGRLRHVLIHAVNPFGFDRMRRVNEDNVDLNRNFLFDDGEYRGAPDGYADLDELLNPASPPSRWEPFRIKALSYVRRLGMQAVKNAVAGGQYEFPLGLFYGGSEPCASARIVRQHCDTWLARAPFAVHIDLHTGLGKYARPTFLLNETHEHEAFSWYAKTLGSEHLEALNEPQGTAYRASGPFGLWMQRHFADRPYRFVGAEFGTYDVIRVLAALRRENRAHHYCAKSTPAYVWAKRELMECFCPESPEWREQTLTAALDLVDKTESGLLREDARQQLA